jgi:hypothetical protein
MFCDPRVDTEFAGHWQSKTSSLPGSEYVLFGQTTVKFASPPGQKLLAMHN